MPNNTKLQDLKNLTNLLTAWLFPPLPTFHQYPILAAWYAHIKPLKKLETPTDFDRNTLGLLGLSQ